MTPDPWLSWAKPSAPGDTARLRELEVQRATAWRRGKTLDEIRELDRKIHLLRVALGKGSL